MSVDQTHTVHGQRFCHALVQTTAKVSDSGMQGSVTFHVLTGLKQDKHQATGFTSHVFYGILLYISSAPVPKAQQLGYKTRVENT
jgi:hypothetical protein